MTRTSSCVLGAGTNAIDNVDANPCTIVTVNRHIAFAYKHQESERPLRGIVLLQLNPLNASNCQFSEYEIFDTHGSLKEAKRLKMYLSTLTNGSVFFGITVSEFTVSLEPARQSLIDIGLPVDCLHFGGALAFAVIIGKQAEYNYFKGYLSTSSSIFFANDAMWRTWMICKFHVKGTTYLDIDQMISRGEVFCLCHANFL